MPARARFVIAVLVSLTACSGGGDGTTAPITGSIAITISGLPGGSGVIVVSGPGGYSRGVSANVTISGLVPGSYTVTASDVDLGTATYAASAPTQIVSVTASATPVAAAVTYAIATGSLTLTISGLPGGVNANVTVSDPNGHAATLTASGTVQDLRAGSHTVTAVLVPVSSASSTYGGTPATQVIVVPASTTPVTGAVAYSVMTGNIAVTISGLPGGGVPNVLVTGPFAYSHTIVTNGLTTLSSLPLGGYTVTPAIVNVAGVDYGPDSATQLANIPTNGATASTAVTYAAQDLSIDGMYITQATQSYTGTVPLITGRAGFLRVFAKARFANALTPPVRVRWYQSGTLVRTDLIPAPGASVPTAITEGTLASSWNLPVPASLIQPGLTVLADVDPSNTVAEGNETNNSFPVNGTPQTLSVLSADSAHITLVPVSTPTGGTGNVNAGNQASFLSFTNKIHPLPGVVITLHATYFTNTSLPLQSDDANMAWEAILTELDALRTADHAPLSEMYYGVVDPAYSGGVAGLGYIAYPVAMGWDKGSNDQIMAHEIGHNWAQYHAPCGNPAGVDLNYPYPGATLGIYGFDVATQTLYAPSTNYDIMSYCRPYWTTDYTYDSVRAYRSHSGYDVVGSQGAEEPALLVWGRMVGGKMVLEPAFEITARAKMPEGNGAYTIEGLDANDTPIFSYAFEAHEIADGAAGARAFSFAIPLSRFDKTRLASLRLSGYGREVRVTGGAARTLPPSKLVLRGEGGGGAHVTWDGASYPMALIRDAATGQIVSFARRGDVRIKIPGERFEVTLSDGVRSVKEVVTSQ